MTPLLFDMDGLLLDTERAAQAAFVALSAAYERTFDEMSDFFLTLVGTSSAVTRDRVSAFLPGVDPNEFGRAWERNMRQQLAERVPVMPHARDVLHRLSARGHPMAVVTSTSGDRARDHLDRAGIAHHFRAVVGGDEVAGNKPDPAPYLAGAAAIGADAQACIAFEDSDIGVKSARAAGCTVVQIPGLRPADRPLPKFGQHIATDLRHAVSLLGLG